MRAIVAAGGWAHPPDALAGSMTKVLQSRGYDVVTVTDAEALTTELHRGTELVVVGSCWFSMSDDRYTQAQREEFAVRASAELKTALSTAVLAGTPVLALHTAVLCFDGWPQWSQWLGAGWNWETSFHPPPGPLVVNVAPDAGVTLGSDQPLTGFTVMDEEYQGLDVQGHVDVVASSADGHPLVWVNTGQVDAAAPARVAVDLLGHDERSLEQPGHQALLHGLLDWLIAGRTGT